MNHPPLPEKLADGGLIVGWALWIVTHLAQINQALQMISLVLASVASICAIIYYARHTK